MELEGKLKIGFDNNRIYLNGDVYENMLSAQSGIEERYRNGEISLEERNSSFDLIYIHFQKNSRRGKDELRER